MSVTVASFEFLDVLHAATAIHEGDLLIATASAGHILKIMANHP